MIKGSDFATVGVEDFLIEEVKKMTVEVEYLTPSELAERIRYLPSGVSPRPGYFRFSVTPAIKEIVDCFGIHHPAREINIMKGSQVAATVGILENVILYCIVHVRNLPVGYITADKELATGRMENYIIPMLNQSGVGHLIRSSDETSNRKTGKTKNQIQWGPEGFLVPSGAQNAAKQRQWSFCFLLKDELDGWPTDSKDGDLDALSDDRTKAFEKQRKIGRMSTPAETPSAIESAYLRGDQRKYFVKCLKCREPQVLRWAGTNDDTGLEYGVKWDYNEAGQVDEESVRYVCKHCGHPHREYDKHRLFAEDNAEWRPTAVPASPEIRSYHLSGLYSPAGMGSWYRCVLQYLEGWDPKTNKMTNPEKYQVFYNNVLAKPFKVYGSRVPFQAVERQRRDGYHFGEIPNDLAIKYTGGRILLLTCAVDVHEKFLAVAVHGWTRGGRCFLIDYWGKDRYGDDSEKGCKDIDSPVWKNLRDFIVEKRYHSNDGAEYFITLTLVDAGWSPDTVSSFCSQFEGGVVPIVGRARPGRSGTITSFSKMHLATGLQGFTLYVDGFKDRLAQCLRREWTLEDENGEQVLQPDHHVNFPLNATEKQLRELTVETKEKQIDKKGNVSWYWARNKKRNELWDLTVYAMGAIDLLAVDYCRNQLKLDAVDWALFWDAYDPDVE